MKHWGRKSERHAHMFPFPSSALFAVVALVKGKWPWFASYGPPCEASVPGPRIWFSEPGVIPFGKPGCHFILVGIHHCSLC
jgi:hypothetical protein